MDFSQLTLIAASINSAKQLGQAALAVRDFNQIAATVSELNNQLLKAQESLFTHNTQLLELQEKHHETIQKLRKLEESQSQRRGYTLFEISDRVFVYRSNLPPERSELSHPTLSEPLHYLCQTCLDKGVKSVLQKSSFYGSISLRCMICKAEFSTGQIESYDV